MRQIQMKDETGLEDSKCNTGLIKNKPTNQPTKFFSFLPVFQNVQIKPISTCDWI